VAPFASFVYTIHAQGIVLERRDLPDQGECMGKVSITFFEILYVVCVCGCIIEEKILGLFTCSVFFPSKRENIGERYLLFAMKQLLTGPCIQSQRSPHSSYKVSPDWRPPFRFNKKTNNMYNGP